MPGIDLTLSEWLVLGGGAVLASILLSKGGVSTTKLMAFTGGLFVLVAVSLRDGLINW